MNDSTRGGNGPATRLGVMFVLALAGLGVNLLLLIPARLDEASTLAGCGPGSGCDAVLGSSWSQVLGMPVTVPGVLIYALLLLALTRAGRPLLAPVLGVIFAAAIWFITVQALLIQAFCPWCMVAHVIGITLTALGLPHAARTCGSWKRAGVTFAAVGLAGALTLIALQVFGPQPETHRVSEIVGETREDVGMMEDAHSAGDGRLAVFFDGRKGYRIDELPHLGRADATHVIIEYFDYACAACRTMGGFLEGLVAAYPDDICVILLPVPLDPACNDSMPPLEPGHPGACELARAAMAVWRASRENFHAFHKAVLAEPVAENATMLAQALLPDAATAMQDPWITSIIDTNINDWHVISADNPKLPKLVIGNRRILHGFPPTEAEFIRVMAGELGLE